MRPNLDTTIYSSWPHGTDEKQSKAQTADSVPPARSGPDEDVVGKAYDSRLMRRLVRYLAPYKLAATVSGFAILLKSASDVAGPYLVKVAVDTYLAPSGKPGWLGRHLSPNAVAGVNELALVYFGALLLSFGLEFVQTYLMQWTGQKIMFDLRSQIFRHIQRMHVGFFDRNPVGRLVTRVTSDVDALNEMFTSGVLAIFEDVFALTFIVVIMLRMSWPLALLTLSVIPGILYATKLFREHVRDSYRRQRAATARINSFTQEYVSGMSVVQLFNRERRAFRDFSAVNLENKIAWTDAIFAYALYYPVVEFLSSLAIALVIWFGGSAVLHTEFVKVHGQWLTAHKFLLAAQAPRCTSLSLAPSRSASSSPSSSTRSDSSVPSRISATNTTYCRPRWPRPSASSNCSIRRPDIAAPCTSSRRRWLWPDRVPECLVHLPEVERGRHCRSCNLHRP